MCNKDIYKMCVVLRALNDDIHTQSNLYKMVYHVRTLKMKKYSNFSL